MTATATALRLYKPAGYPQIGESWEDFSDGLKSFTIGELQSIANLFNSYKVVIKRIDTVSTPLTSAANDAAAAVAGVPLNGLYHTAGAVKMRLV